MMKVILKVQVNNEREKQKAMRVVSGLQGVDSISLELKDQKMTVTGDIDPVCVVRKLRKLYPTEIASAGPAKEPEKKKDEPKKEDKKDEPKALNYIPHYPFHVIHPPYPSYPYAAYPVEEDPNACVIC